MKVFYMAEKKYVWVLADNDIYNWESWYEVEKGYKEDDPIGGYDMCLSSKGCVEIISSFKRSF